MRLATRIFALGLCLAAYTLPARADQQCTTADYAAASNSKLSSLDWQGMFDSYSRFKQCDDGDVGEGYSDAIVHLLATQWASVDKLLAISEKHADFKKFVLRHIDATASEDDLDKIIGFSAEQCSTSAKALCKKIVKRAKAAKAEIEEQMKSSD